MKPDLMSRARIYGIQNRLVNAAVQASILRSVVIAFSPRARDSGRTPNPDNARRNAGAPVALAPEGISAHKAPCQKLRFLSANPAAPCTPNGRGAATIAAHGTPLSRSRGASRFRAP